MRNKGTCWYRLYATDQDKTVTNIWLCEFTRGDTGDDTIDSIDFFGLRYNTDYFDANGRTNTNCRLDLDSNSALRFTSNGITYNWFSVAVVAGTETIRPGDDMLLRFKLAEAEDLASYKPSEYDFLAVVDYKLLWRANLHLDEQLLKTGQSSGQTDWNNRNPWYQPEPAQPNYNAWSVSQASGADEDGGQIRIKPWTRFFCYANTATGQYFLINQPGLENWGGGEVHNATAYSWACVDSVFHFNADMIDQAIAQGNDPNAIDSTLALTVPAQANNNFWLNYNSTVNNGYVPGYSMYRHKLYTMTESDQHHSAGSDCDSFIIMSASYDDTFYQVHVPDDRETTASAKTLHSRRTGTLESGYPISLPDFLVPGDIVEFPLHWAMVMYVNRKPDPLNPSTIEERITLIEATDWGYLRVMNQHTINSYTSLIPPSPVLGYFRLGIK